jgi:hypothetical protein
VAHGPPGTDYETATVYEGQGSQVYKAYWQDLFRWGGGNPKVATFHPYWDNAKFLEVGGLGQDTLVSCYVQAGKVLLIASNRKKDPSTARITLNLAALGLPANVKATEWDSSFEPPPGEDFHGLGNVQKESEALLEASDAMALETNVATAGQDLLGGPLADDKQTAAADRAKYTPTLSNGVLTLPIRGRDFRVIALE